MSPVSSSKYPDISDVLARKSEGRRELASLSFGEKIDILEAMLERDQTIRTAREARRAGRQPALKAR